MPFRGLQCNHRQMWLTLTVLLALVAAVAQAKHVQQQSHRVHHRSSGDETTACDGLFDRLNVTATAAHGKHRIAGPVCGGHCCDNTTEQELTTTSSNQFANNLRIHTKNLRSILEKTAETFKGHLLQLTYASENKTLTVFTQVYRHLSPLSRHPIVELYQQIRHHINGHNDFDFDTLVTKFFSTLFPVAYHRAVHSTDTRPQSTVTAPAGDFHGDYKNCLRHTYDELQPFGSIPKTLATSLQHSLNAASVFVSALEHAADILASTEDLTADSLAPKCRQHLLKMTYCNKCGGSAATQIKSCYGYCQNVLRGCLAQYVGVLDGPWSKVAETIDQLWNNSVRTENGAEEVLKTLDAKLSAAIMHTLENAQELEKKVKKACGNPTLLPTSGADVDADSAARSAQSAPSGHHHQYKPMTPPPNTEMLRLLVDIYQSKDFYANIVNRICEEDDFEQTDTKCWTGTAIGQYTQTVMAIGDDTQRYNPEVPLEADQFVRSTRLNELADKLIKLRNTIEKPSPAYSDVQNDQHYEEGTNDGGSGYQDENDDEEYTMNTGSGDGSGDGSTTHEGIDGESRHNNNNNESVTAEPAAASASLHACVPLLAALAFAVLALQLGAGAQRQR